MASHRPFAATRAVSLPILLLALALAVCHSETTDNPKLTIDNRNLQQKVQDLVEQEDFIAAAECLDRAVIPSEVAQALAKGDRRWMAVENTTVIFPGVTLDIHNLPKPDEFYVLPGTGCVMDEVWSDAATRFAEKYNLELADQAPHFEIL